MIDRPHHDQRTPDTAVDTPDGDETSTRHGRRAVIAGLVGVAGVGAGVGAWIATRDGGTAGPPPDDAARTAIDRPVDAGGFANRDESYAGAGAGGATTTTAPPPTLLYPTAAEAAAAASPSMPTILDTSDPALHLLRRATFGPTAAALADVHDRGLDAWIATQLAPEQIDDPAGELAWGSFPLAGADAATIRRETERHSWTAMQETSAATLGRQAWSERQLQEVMVDFWANHLNVPTPGPAVWDVAGSYQTEVIRAHALGTFRDMLTAAARHPALLQYLTASRSTADSVNENLGRELLELHTVSVAAGYTEADVRNSSYILTGRSVTRDDEAGGPGAFVYRPEDHWLGPVSVLDFRHDNASREGGLDVGDAYLAHLATHEATARSIARKMAVRFVADVPPPALVDRLAAAYLDHDTAVVPVLDTLFRSVEFWSAPGQKLRRPSENITASVRALDLRPEGDIARAVGALHNAASRAGNRPLSWPAPNGYPDVQVAWRSAGGLTEIWRAHRMLAGDWQDGLTRPDLDALLAGQPATTVGDLVDGLCRRLCFQTFPEPQRAALVGFLGGDAAAPVQPYRDNNRAGVVVALVLDSPWFSLR